MSELVNCLFEGYDKLTLITNFVPRNDHENYFGERSLVFMVKTNGIKDAYALSDFHAAVMSHLTSHRLAAMANSTCAGCCANSDARMSPACSSKAVER